MTHALPREIGTIVVGGGILGRCVAGFLADEGRDVAIIDAGIAEGTSTNAGSLHVQMQSRFMRMYPDQVPALEATLHLYPKAVAFWQELESQLGSDFELKITGGLMVAESAEQLTFLATKAKREGELGLDAYIVERHELDRMAPYLGPAVVGAELCANEGKVNPLRANAALERWTSQRGVIDVRQTAVTRLTRAGTGWGVETTSGNVRAGSVVVAAGAGCKRLVEPFGIRLPIEAEPLHMNLTEPVAHFIDHLVQHADRPVTLKQFASGHVVIGGGWPAELSGDRGTAGVKLASLIGNATLAQHIVPAIGALRLIRCWAGVNTTTDGKGILGPVPGAPNVFLAVPGDAGYTLGPLSARMVADSILGRGGGEDITPFSCARFA